MRLRPTWVVEHHERYMDYQNGADAMDAFDSVVLGDDDYKYLFIAYDDDGGEFHPELDVGLMFEGTGIYE